MLVPSDPFYRLLEHYLFGAASKFIHLANPGEQNQLIDLISLVNDQIDSLASVDIPVPAQQKDEPRLIKAAELANPDDHWLAIQARRQAQREEAYIHHLEKAIHITEMHARYIDRQFCTEPDRSVMLERNKHILGVYQRHLAELTSNKRTIYQQFDKLITYLRPNDK